MKKLLLLSILFPFSAANLAFADDTSETARSFSGIDIPEWVSGTTAKVGLGAAGTLVLGYAGYKLYNKFFGVAKSVEPVVADQVKSVDSQKRDTAKPAKVYINSVLSHLPEDSNTWQKENLENCLRGLEAILSAKTDFYGKAQELDADMGITLGELKATLEVICYGADDKLFNHVKEQLGDAELAIDAIKNVHTQVATALIAHLKRTFA